MIERDVIILGAGPAGLSAAAELARLKVGKIAVLDREQAAGGIPRHCGHLGYGWNEFRRIMTGPAYARRLAETAGAAELKLGVTALRLEPGGVVQTTGAEGPQAWRGRAVLLALGARETPRSARLVSGARPWGVMNTGALQQFVYLHGKRPFERPVIIGSELVAFSTLLTLRHVKVRPAAMIEAGRRITAQRPGDWIARLAFGVPVLLDTRLIRILGHERVEGVEVDRGNGPERLDCDGVVFTGRFRPENALLAGSHLAVDPGTRGPAIDQLWRCSDPAYFAAGNLLRGIETAGQCWREGQAAARIIAATLLGKLAPPAASVPVQAAGALAYVYPQRLTAEDPIDPELLFFARARAATKGAIVLRGDDTVIWSRQIDALPERRIAWPVSPKDLQAHKSITVSLEPQA
ncbi:NAD(P)/FAD-dependent oxidoreductase [Dongia sedimenti]|uniref:FAD/NAD(P)-binding oxidoreductase n=1 Tax=Dongia sedimenti TaxID=3064282 RepID=A0ABU0YRD0_9PROT|nr:FAD/NAD(P)-binding oxidoreductase [Rhodospirillaceae bacterium R-7]